MGMGAYRASDKSPHRWELAETGGTRWHFGGLWRRMEMGVTQKKRSENDPCANREHERKIAQTM